MKHNTCPEWTGISDNLKILHTQLIINKTQKFNDTTFLNMRNLQQTILLLTCVTLGNYSLVAQYRPAEDSRNFSSFTWPEGIRVAVSLSFDDARQSQVINGVPLLDRHNVSATFYVSTDSIPGRLSEWRAAVLSGHDIGNHTLKHGCTGNFLWSRENALENYTLEELENEIMEANRILEDLLGIIPSSFGYPCGQTYVGRGTETKSYVPIIASHFESGRLWLSEGPNDPGFCDFAQLTGIKLDGHTFSEIREMIDSEKFDGKWLILAGHETVNDIGNYDLATSLSTIDSICMYAKDPANGIWIDNVHNVVRYIKQNRIDVSGYNKNTLTNLR